MRSRHFKIFYIAGYRIELPSGISPGFTSSLSFPGVLDIGILRYIIAFHLDVGRHPDVIPGNYSQYVFLLKARNRTLIIFCIVEFPESVQALLEALPPSAPSPPAECIIPVIGMGRYPILAENKSDLLLSRNEIHSFLITSLVITKVRRISDLQYPPFFVFSYLTAPVIPSVKLFWKKKKMIAVGIVQISTPSISIP